MIKKNVILSSATPWTSLNKVEIHHGSAKIRSLFCTNSLLYAPVIQKKSVKHFIIVSESVLRGQIALNIIDRKCFSHQSI